MKPIVKRRYEKTLAEKGWEGLYREAHCRGMDHFPELEGYGER